MTMTRLNVGQKHPADTRNIRHRLRNRVRPNSVRLAIGANHATNASGSVSTRGLSSRHSSRTAERDHAGISPWGISAFFCSASFGD